MHDVEHELMPPSSNSMVPSSSAKHIPRGPGAADSLSSAGVPSPARHSAFPAWPYFDDEVIDSVVGVLRSGRVNYWTGEECRSFEQEFAAVAGTRHAVALANGSLALEAALLAAGVRPGDEVVTTSRTFVASASSAVLIGATPRFADVDRDSQNLTIETLSRAVSSRTKAIVAVHLAGWPCEMDPIMAFARERGIVVVEDCAQAHGARYRGRPVGSIGDVAAWSFCQDKIMTLGGEGGAVTTNSDSIWDRVWSLKEHGKSYDAVHSRLHPPGFRWVHESFGSNWRLTEMQAAMGRVLLRRLPAWVAARRHYAELLNRAFQKQPALRVTVPPAHVEHSYYKYYAFVRPEALKTGWTRDRIMNAIVREGVPCFTGTCSEIYLEKCFVNSGLAPAERHPIARELGETSLMFLVHPTLTTADLEDTIAAVERVLADASAQ